MKEPKYNDWLQVAGFIGVIAGLLLVAFEVRQANKIAEAETVRSGYEAWDSIQVSSFESDLFNAYIKSFEDPDNLTSVEIMKLDAWLSSSMNRFDNQITMQRMGLQPYDAVEDLIGNFEFFFGSQFGRAWYLESARFWLEPELVTAIDREISIRPVRSSPKLIENIRSRIRTGDLSP